MLSLNNPYHRVIRCREGGYNNTPRVLFLTSDYYYSKQHTTFREDQFNHNAQDVFDHNTCETSIPSRQIRPALGILWYCYSRLCGSIYRIMAERERCADLLLTHCVCSAAQSHRTLLASTATVDFSCLLLLLFNTNVHNRWALPGTDEVYEQYVRSKGIKPQSVNLMHGAKGHWVGDPNAENVLIWYHGRF